MTEEGIEFKTNMKIGVDINAKGLLEQYDAMCLCVGSTWPRDLPIPGKI